MSVTGAVLGAGAPAGSTINTDLSEAGPVTVHVTLSSAITGSGALELVRIQASVPLSAADLYTQKAVLDLRGVSINGGAIASSVDDGVFVDAYVGDASANRAYSTLDVQRLQRVVVHFDTGLAAYPLLDPAILGDTSGNGVLNSLDVQRLRQLVVGLPQTTIPPLPTPPLPPRIFSGADPTLIVGSASAVAGRTVQAPITMDEMAGIESIQLSLQYATEWLTLLGVSPAGAAADFQFRADHSAPGTLTIDASRLQPVGTSGPASLFMLEFQVAQAPPPGTIAIDLQQAVLNDSWLTVEPAPTPGPDASDGKIVVRKAPRIGGTSAINNQVAAASTGTVALQPELLAPTIGLALSWDPMAVRAGETELRASTDNKDWQRDFVLHLGQPETTRHANHRLRVALPVAPAVSGGLGRL